jgi:hypothetical protein
MLQVAELATTIELYEERLGFTCKATWSHDPDGCTLVFGAGDD